MFSICLAGTNSFVQVSLNLDGEDSSAISVVAVKHGLSAPE